MKEVKRFFWLCSGSHHAFLEDSPSEASKYAGIGATIFFTGIFAALAGGFALFTVFDNTWIAIVLGLLWGLMIFNLDRYIVSSMRKKDEFWLEFRTAIPRIILAVLIAVVITKPLELKVFEKEIDTELIAMNEEILAKNESAIRNRFQPKLESLNLQNESLKQELLSKEQKRDELRTIAQKEADGTGGTMKRNAGPIYRIKKADADKIEQELQEMREVNQKRIAENDLVLAQTDSLMTAELAAIEKNTFNGMAARLEALGHLSADHPAIWWANAFFILLFIAVETAPVLVKLISSKGPYDHLQSSEEYGFRVSNLENIARINQEARQRSGNLAGPEKGFIDEKLESGLNKV